MGSFSWIRADKRSSRKNISIGDKYKLLIPKEFGGGFLVDKYFDYGYLFYDGDNYNGGYPTNDLYGILAYWNKCEGMDYEGDEYPSTMEDILWRGHTTEQNNRIKGIEIGCYDEDIDKLKYPLKLVSMSYDGTYEDCDMRSYGDPVQGFYKTYWDGREEKYD